MTDVSPHPKVAFRVEETPETPWLGLIFGSAAMVPFAIGAVCAWVLPDSVPVARLTAIWGGAVLAFLAGVRRGLSFRTPNGADFAQMATMLWLFVLALAALVSPWPILSLALLIVGYASIAVLDPAAATRREAPLFFRRLRPVQMLVPVIGLGAVVAALLIRG